eukprot:199323_1
MVQKKERLVMHYTTHNTSQLNGAIVQLMISLILSSSRSGDSVKNTLRKMLIRPQSARKLSVSTAQRLAILAFVATITSLILYYFVSSAPDECSTNPESCRDVHINIDQRGDDIVVNDNNPTLLFLRHGIRLDKVANDKIEWNDRKERYYDTPLSDYDLPLQIAGNIQNNTKLLHFKPYKMIISPYRRCLETAAIAANRFGITKLEIDSRIGEISHDPTTGNSLLPDDAHYITFDEMKQLIFKHLKRDQSEVEIEWNHREEPGNNQWNEALNEYKSAVSRSDGDDKYLVFVVHAGILMNVGDHTCCKGMNDLKMDYCAWYAINALNDGLIASGNMGQDMQSYYS